MKALMPPGWGGKVPKAYLGNEVGADPPASKAAPTTHHWGQKKECPGSTMFSGLLYTLELNAFMGGVGRR